MKRDEKAILEAAHAGDTEAMEELTSENQPGQRRPTRRNEDPPKQGDKQKERRIPKRTPVPETNFAEGDKKTMKTRRTQAQVTTPETKATTPETKLTGTQPTNPTTQPKPEFRPCPLCGHGKSDGKFLVCKACNDRYVVYANEVAKEIAAGKKDVVVLSKVEWVLSQLDLARFEKELEEVRQKRVGVRERAIEKARTAGAGKTLPREVFTSLVAQYEKQEGDELYFQVRRLNARLTAATKLKPELEKMVQEKAAQAVAPTAEPAPVQEEPLAEAQAEATTENGIPPA